VGESLAGHYSRKILWFQDPHEKTPSDLPAMFVPVALPLRQFIAVLARCSVLICNDSGPMHIASALEVATVAVFGPTEPVWFGPLGKKNRIVINPAFWCRPCADRCIFDQPYCLRTISTEEVFRQAAAAVSGLRLGIHAAGGARIARREEVLSS
jgi:ADP-heptose:LPS heptosyltransferase